jgi:hypothetical protein
METVELGMTGSTQKSRYWQEVSAWGEKEVHDEYEKLRDHRCD